MLRKLLEFLIEAFSLAGKMEAEGAVPYEWEDLNTWANRPYAELKNRIAELSETARGAGGYGSTGK